MGSVDAYCRFCAQELEHSRSRNIFSSENRHLLSAALQCIPRAMTANDPYPNHACYPCVYKLNNFNEFQENGLSALKVFDDIISAKDNMPLTPDHSELLMADDDASSGMESNEETDDLEGAEFSSRSLSERLKFHQFLSMDDSIDFSPLGEENFTEADILVGNDKCAAGNFGNATSEIRPEVRGQPAQAISVSNFRSRKNKRTGHREYKCEQCPVYLCSMIRMQAHIRSHTGEKPHQCEKCQKCFSRLDNLVRHSRTHLDQTSIQHTNREKSIRPRRQHIANSEGTPAQNSFQCEKCNKCFKSKNYLADHKRIHTGERPFHCDVCGKSFTFKTILTRHKTVDQCQKDKKI